MYKVVKMPHQIYAAEVELGTVEMKSIVGFVSQYGPVILCQSLKDLEILFDIHVEDMEVVDRV